MTPTPRRAAEAHHADNYLRAVLLWMAAMDVAVLIGAIR